MSRSSTHRTARPFVGALVVGAMVGLTGCTGSAPVETAAETTTGSTIAPDVAEPTPDPPAGEAVELLDTNVFDAVTDGELVYFVATNKLRAVDVNTRVTSDTPSFESAEETTLATYPGRNGQAVLGGGAVHILDLDTLYTFGDSFDEPPVATSFDVSPLENVTKRRGVALGDSIWVGTQATEELELATGRSVQLIEFASDSGAVTRYIGVDIPSREAPAGQLNRDDNDTVVDIDGDSDSLYAALSKGVVKVDLGSGETTATFDVEAYDAAQGRETSYGSRLTNLLLTETALGGGVLVVTVLPEAGVESDHILVLDATTLEVIGDYAHEYANGTPEVARDGSLLEFDGELWAASGVSSGGLVRLSEPDQGDEAIIATAYLTRDVRGLDPISQSTASALSGLLVLGDRLVGVGESNGLWIFDPGTLPADPDPEA